MSSEQIIIAIGFGQLIFMALVFFRIDHRIFRRFVSKRAASPIKLNVSLPSRRDKLVIILLVGGLAFSGFGYYQTLQSRPPQSGVTTKNVELKVRQWLEGLPITTQKPPGGMCFVMQGFSQSGIPFVIAQQKDHDQYLVLQVYGVFSPEHRDVFDKMSATEQTEFIQGLASQAAREKINLAQVGATSTIERRLAINDSLTEASFMSALDELCAEALTVKGIITDAFNRREKRSTPPSLTPNTAASPH